MSIDKRMDEVRNLAQRGEMDSALALVKGLINEHPDEAELWSLQGSLYARSEDYNKAVSNLNQAIILSPERAGFYYHRGRYHMKSGNVSKALDDFSGAISRDNQDDITFTQVLYFHRAEAFIKLGKKQDALSDLTHIPENYQWWTFKLRSKADLMADCKKL